MSAGAAPINHAVVHRWAGMWALWRRALQVDSRSPGMTALRWIAVSVPYLLLVAFTSQPANFGRSVGNQLFATLSACNLGLIGLTAVSLFATSVVEEREEDSLGLLQMSGLTPAAILLGKWGGRLVAIALLIALQIPFMLIYVTIGGVSYGQVAAAYWMLFAVLWCAANLGLLCSVLCSNASWAMGTTFAAIAAWCFVPHMLAEFLQGWMFVGGAIPLLGWSAIEELRKLSPPVRLFLVLQSGFVGSSIDVSLAIFWVVGLLEAGLAWLCFPTTESPPKPRAVRPQSVNEAASLLRRATVAKRASDRCPMLLRDLLHEHGLKGLFWRCAYYAGLAVCCFVFWIDWRKGQLDLKTANEAMIVFGWPAIALELSWTASCLFGPEVHGQTWSLLVMTPVSFWKIVLQKLAAGVVLTIPAAVYLVCIIGLSSHGWWFVFGSWDSNHSLAIVRLLAILYGAIPIAMWLSTLVRRGSSFFALGATLGIMILCAIVLDSGRGTRNAWLNSFQFIALVIWVAGLVLTWRALRKATETC